MINNKEVLEEIRNEWETVRTAQAMIKGNTRWAFAKGAPLAQEFQDLSNSLVLFFAFSVLEEALKQLRDESVFQSRSSGLKKLMYGSRTALPWVDFPLVDEGHEHRNEIAHDRLFLTRERTDGYIDAIEIELLAWSIIEEKPTVRYSIGLGVGE